MSLANFQETLKQLGADDIERGKAIGVSERTIRLWKAKEPRIIQLLASNLPLVQALLRDAELSRKSTESVRTVT